MKINQKERIIVFLFSLNYRNYKEGYSIQDGKGDSNGEKIIRKTKRE
jgi:hypothetical protein